MVNSFGSRSVLDVGGRKFEIHRLAALEKAGFSLARLPFSLRILLENLLRTEDGRQVKEADIRALAGWEPKAEPTREIAFTPARVLLQDFTGVPAVVDLAAMRAAMRQLGGDPERINPLLPAELVIDHSVQVDEFGHAERAEAQRADRVHAQQGALRLPALGSDGVRQFRGGSAGHRHRPPGEPRVPRPRRVRGQGRRQDRRGARVPRTRWSAPTRTRRWSTASGSWAGASAASRPKRRCWGSRCRC